MSSSNTIKLTADQEAAMGTVALGQPVHVTGGPGTGKTTLALAAMASASRTQGSWAPGLLLTPDRRRAREVESRLARVMKGAVSGFSADGSHRLVRSLSSYAYLVIGLWLVERRKPRPRMPLVSGAAEDAWMASFLAEYEDSDFSSTVLDSPRFRMEIRNLIARSGEAGLLPEDLGWLGQRYGVHVWQIAADVYEAYAGGDVFGEETRHLDAARAPLIAANLLKKWSIDADAHGVLAPVPLPSRVVVDDIQDMPPSALPLLKTMSDLGVQVVFTGNASEATAAYRGGQANLGADLASAIGAASVELNIQHRLSPATIPVVAEVAGWLGSDDIGKPTATSGNRKRSADAKVTARTFPSQSHLREYIAATLRNAQLRNGTRWQDMAVIVRNSGAIDGIQRSLIRNGVPVQIGERPVVLSKVPLVASLLALLTDPVDAPAEILDSQALALTVSPLVGADSLGLFRLLRDFRAWVDVGQPSGLIALFDALSKGTYVPRAARSQVTAQRVRVAADLWNIRGEAQLMPAQQGLWRLWSAAGISEELREASFAKTPGGRLAGEQLDGVLALFRKADLWTQEREQSGQTTAFMFAQEVLGQEVETDPLVPRGLAEAGVWVVTPAQAAGREWDEVVVAGLEEGVWPRSPQFGIGELPRLEAILSDAQERGWKGQDGIHPYVPDRGVGSSEDRLTALMEKRLEETRLFLVALSRSFGSTHLVSMSDDALQGVFFTNLTRKGGTLEIDPKVKHDDGPTANTIPGLIAQMRRTLVSDAATEDEKKNAAAVLALLWKEGVEEAAPAAWAVSGSLSTDSPILDSGPIRVGPSSIETAKKCALRWFLTDVGGRNEELHVEAERLDGALIGNIIHRLAQEHPTAGPDELRQALASTWEEIGLGMSTVWERRAFQEMSEMVTVMGQHFSAFKGEVRTEHRLSFTVGNLTVSGRADRIEITDDGKARVIDIKTGKSDKRAKGEGNAQLTAYQLGLSQSGYEPAGAALLVLRASDPVREQAALSPDDIENARAEIAGLEPHLGGARLLASPATGDCRTCPFRHVCPAQSESARSYE